MALFNRKLTADDIIKALSDLSDDDKEKVRQSLKDRVDESVGEQEHEQGTEDSQTAKDRVDESIGAEAADEGETEEEVVRRDEQEAEEQSEPETEEQTEEEKEEGYSAFDARIAVLEDTVAKYGDMIEALTSKLEDGDFGRTPAPASEQVDNDGEDDRIMKAYYGANFRR